MNTECYAGGFALGKTQLCLSNTKIWYLILGKLLTAGGIVQRKVTFNCHSGRNKDIRNSIIFPNASRLELYSMPFQKHWTMKWVLVAKHIQLRVYLLGMWVEVQGKVRLRKWALEIVPAQGGEKKRNKIVSAHPLYANSPGQNEFQDGIHIIMQSSFIFHWYSSFFIPYVGRAQTAVSHHGAITFLATPLTCGECVVAQNTSRLINTGGPS